MTVSDCIHRGFVGTDADCACSSPDLIHGGTVPLSFCQRCPYVEPPGLRGLGDLVQTGLAAIGVTKERVAALTGGDCGCDKRQAALNRLVPFVRPAGKPDHPESRTSSRWTVAVTTSPRRNCTLTACIDSIRSAGWEPIIFAEPGSTTIDCQTFTNVTRRGVWHNWLASARWCLDNTASELILTVQDDSLFHPQSRDFAESILWPDSKCGFVSLYTPKHYTIKPDATQRAAGVNRIRTNSLWGACALIWDRRILEAVVSHRIATKWQGVAPTNKNTRAGVMARRKSHPETIANSDTAIGNILNAMKLHMWFADPSPVSHIAVHSTIGHGDNRGRRNCYRCADHAQNLSDQIPKPKQLFAIGGGPNPTGEPEFDAARNRWYKLGYKLSMSCSLELWQAIKAEVRPDDHTLEFGCGVSTSAFAAAASHVAVESDRHQAKRFSSAVYRSLHPQTGFYRDVPPGVRRVILVDGPHGGQGALRMAGVDKIMEVISPDTVIFVDDVNRPNDRLLAEQLAERTGHSLTIKDYERPFAVLRPVRSPAFRRKSAQRANDSA